MSIDWSRPLETDEETPRTVNHWRPVPGSANRLYVTLKTGRYALSGEIVYRDDGKPDAGGVPWLRNVRAVDTSRDEAFRRMEALTRRMAILSGSPIEGDAYEEAREILKMLPAPPVDPLLIEARKLVADCVPEKMPPGYYYDDGDYTRIALAALKRGQELAHGEYEVCGAVSYSRGTYPTYQRRSEAAGIEPGK